MAGLFANNFLPGGHKRVHDAHLVASLAICVFTIKESFKSCCFSIEIEIMYWMYWGGVACVILCSPNPVRFGPKPTWVDLTWRIALQFTLHGLMLYHAIWYTWYGYDRVLARFPCGTYHFFFAPFLDPGPSFWLLRDLGMQSGYLYAVLLTFFFPVAVFVLILEIKDSVQQSIVWEFIWGFLDQRRPSETGTVNQQQSTLELRRRPKFRLAYELLKWPNGKIRHVLGLPSARLGGIRLVTPLDISYRRTYRYLCLGFGLTSCIVSIMAVELIIAWNKIVGDSIFAADSPGQYAALIAGIWALFSVLWQIFEQKLRHSRDHRRQQLARQMADSEVELQPLTLQGFVEHAFGQPDVEFLTLGGLLPTSEYDIVPDTGESDDPLEPDPETPHLERSSISGHYMTGALEVR